jgi:serine/threonine-protein kinase
MEGMEDQLVGRTLLNRYRVDALIGHGGMADVYRVYDARRAASLAIKVLRADLAQDQELLGHFSQEARLLQALNHPHIVRFYELQQDGDTVFIVMDYVEGSNLRRVIQEHGGPFRESECLAYLQPVCRALYYAHCQSVFHCDIKPSNILTGLHSGEVYVSDFGVARITAGHGGQGTPSHMAPEQFTGGWIDARTDIYSLGVLLYEMVTGGRRPFQGESRSASQSTLQERIGWEHLHQPPPSPRVFNPALSPAMEAVILRALAKRPDQRYAATLEFLSAVEDAARRETPPAEASAAGPDEPLTLIVPPADPADFPGEDALVKTGAPTPPRPAEGPAGLRGCVLVRRGDNAGRWYDIQNDPWIIGRSREADLRFTSPRVSRRHAAIRRGRGYFYIQDLNSTVGTLVNGKPIQIQPIRTGDILSLGDVELEFRVLK